MHTHTHTHTRRAAEDAQEAVQAAAAQEGQVAEAMARLKLAEFISDSDAIEDELSRGQATAALSNARICEILITI